jgi:hypothetical protein
MARAFSNEYGVVHDPILDAWVLHVGSQLTAVAPRHDLNYHFTILDTAEVNAFTLPGGYVFVTRGLLDSLVSQDELACVMGHEVGHVTHRDPIRIIEWQLGLSLTVAYGPVPHSQLATILEQAAIFLTTLSFSRQDEYRADQYGLRFGTAAGYDPNGLVQFLESLGIERKASFFARYLATHPPNGDRLKAIQRTRYFNARQWALQEKIGSNLLANYRPAIAVLHFQAALQGNPPAAAAARLRQEVARARTMSGAPAIASATGLVAGPVGGAGNENGGAVRPQAPTQTVGPPDPAQEAALQAIQTASIDLRAPVESVYRTLVKYNGLVNMELGLQDGLLGAAASALDDVKWLALAYQAYGAVNQLNDFYACVVRVDSRILPTLAAMETELKQMAPGDPREPELCASAMRLAAEARVASDEMEKAASKIGVGADLMGAVLGDLDMALLGFKSQVSYVRLAGLQATLVAARVEIDQGRKDGNGALASLNQAEVRALLAQLNQVASGASPARLLTYDHAVQTLTGASLESMAAIRAQGLPYGDAVMAAVLAREASVQPDTIISRFRAMATAQQTGAITTWADVMVDRRVSAISVEIVLHEVYQAVLQEANCA